MSFRSSSSAGWAALREALAGTSVLRVAGTDARVAGSPLAAVAELPARASRRPSAAASSPSPSCLPRAALRLSLARPLSLLPWLVTLSQLLPLLPRRVSGCLGDLAVDLVGEIVQLGLCPAEGGGLVAEDALGRVLNALA